nr:reverse transcriptase domain-containing protein [Tanacetum cinerariifolium]
QAERGWIFISQDKYVVEILKKFDFKSVKTASTPIDTKKPLVKDVEAADVDVRILQKYKKTRQKRTRERKEHTPNVVEPELRTIVEMADNRTMEELLQAPTEGVWYNKEPPNSILTWEDLVNKFMNLFIPPSKTTHLKNEISRFTQIFKETFGEAWERCKEMLRASPHDGFTKLAQIDTFYNGLNDNDQDSLNAAVGGNLLKNTSKSDDRIDKLADQIWTLVDIFAKKIVTPAPVKAVEKSCITCGGNHAYYNCPNTDSNQPSVCVATGTYNQVAPQNRASNYMARRGFAPVQNSQNRLRNNTTQSTQISKINDLIGEIIPCSDLSSRNVPALSAKCPGIPTASDEFPLPEDFPTASEERFPLLRKSNPNAEEDCTADEDKGKAVIVTSCTGLLVL